MMKLELLINKQKKSSNKSLLIAFFSSESKSHS